MKIKIFILLLLPALFFAGCRSRKSSTVKTETNKTETLQENTKTTTVTEETASGLVSIPGDTLSAGKPLSGLQAGEVLQAETDALKVTVFIDPVSGNIKATAVSKPRTVPVNINRKTTKTEDRQTQTEKRESVAVVEKKKEIVPPPPKPGFRFGFWSSAGLVAGAVAIGYAGGWIVKRRKREKNFDV